MAYDMSDLNTGHLIFMRELGRIKSFSNFIASPFKKLLRQDTALQRYRQNEWLDQDSLESLQSAKLRNRVRHAYDTIPYYRRLLDDHKVSPSDIRTIEDMDKLPVVRKSDLKRHDLMADLRSSDIPRSDCILHRSTGTTGEPFYVVKSVADFKTILHSLYHRRKTWAGLGHGGRGIAMGNRENLVRSFERTHVKPSQILMGAQPINGKEFMRVYDAYKPEYIRAYPEVLVYLGRYALGNGLNPTLKAAMTGGNSLLPRDRELIEKAFDTKVSESYLSTEMELIASECEHGSKHLFSDHIVAETLEAKGAGRAGNAVLTNLDSRAMPFIRYETGDLISFTGKRCKCGRCLPVIETKGRATDVIITPEKRFLYLQSFVDFFFGFKGVLNFRIVQDEERHVSVTLHVDGSFSRDGEQKISDALSERLDSMAVDITGTKEPFPVHTTEKVYRLKNTVKDKLLAA